MKIPIYQVDAFTEKLFGGNPAAVCPLETWLPDRTMQAIGAENNLSETAFFVRAGGSFEIRWFTPEVEVDLCGHATLASGHVIFNHLGHQGSLITFQSQSGELRVKKVGDLLYLDFPASEPEPFDISSELSRGLGRKPSEAFRGRDVLAVFESEEDILSLEPDFAELKKIECLGIIVTAPGRRSDFVSRFFAPRAGINEDPVTGSAHTLLVPFWSNRLKKKKFHAFQVSKRGGELFCEDLGARVLIGGRAVTFFSGQIEIPMPTALKSD
jgi:PhzF family phenazine biosynthesis protein